MKRAVALINAAPYKDYSVADRVYFPTLLLYLATILHEDGNEVRLIDLKLGRVSEEQLEETLQQIDASLVVIHFTTKEVPDAVQIAELTRSVLPHALIGATGLHATMYPRQVIADPAFDLAVEGDAEPAILALATAAANNQGVSGIPNVWSKTGTTELSIRAPGQLIATDMDALPLPNFELLDLSLYTTRDLGFMTGDYRPQTIFRFSASRGCIYKCDFCTDPFKGYQRFSNQAMLRQLEHVVAHCDPDTVFFDDPEFFARKAETLELLEQFEKRFRFKCVTTSRAHYYRPDYLSVDVMKRHRERWVMWDCGGESSNPDYLRTMRKGVSIEHLRNLARYCKESGTLPGYSFMVGMPGESEQDMVSTVQFMQELKGLAGGKVFVTYQYYQPIGPTGMAQRAEALGFQSPRSLRDWEDVFDPATGSTRIELHPWIKRPEFIEYLMLVVRFVVNEVFRPFPGAAEFRHRLAESWDRRNASGDFADLWEVAEAHQLGIRYFSVLQTNRG